MNRTDFQPVPASSRTQEQVHEASQNIESGQFASPTHSPDRPGKRDSTATYRPSWQAIVLFVLALILVCFVAANKVTKITKYWGFTQSERDLAQKLQQLVQRRLNFQSTLKSNSSELEHLANILARVEPTLQYSNLYSYVQFYNQLPLCLIITTPNNDSIRYSIYEQGYQNYRQVELPELSTTASSNTSFLQYQQKLVQLCDRQGYPVYVFINDKLRESALSDINMALQTENVYAIMGAVVDGLPVVTHRADLGDSVVGVDQLADFLLKGRQQPKRNNEGMQSKQVQHKSINGTGLTEVRLMAVYSRVFQLARLISQSKNIPIQDIPFAVLELCAYHVRLVDYSSLFIPKQDKVASLIRLKLDSQSTKQASNRTIFQPLQSLDQDHFIDEKAVNQMFYQVLSERDSSSIAMYHKYKGREFTIADIVETQENQQILYLPQEHFLRDREQAEFEKYEEKQTGVKKNNKGEEEQEEETRFCVTVLNRNNEQHQRYAKALRSVLQQDYRNYHLVFVDDASEDGSLALARRLLRERNFTRATFVRTLRRRYGTYNFVLAAHRFCAPDEVQVLLDGDDELVGTRALRYLALHYAAGAWVVYSAYKGDNYLYGFGEEWRREADIRDGAARSIYHLMSPVRSWRVALLRQVPLAHHRLPDGTWFEVGYDNAIQLPLFERAGLHRVRMVRKMLYLAHTNYGGNDGNTPEKNAKRDATYNHVLKLQPLQKMTSIDENTLSQQQMTNNIKQLAADQGTIYEVLKD